jgi:hypothetical protein
MKKVILVVLAMSFITGLLFAQVPPVNFTGTFNPGTGNVNLSWQAPLARITHMNGSFAYIFGDPEASTSGGVLPPGADVDMQVAQRFTPADRERLGIDGLFITSIGWVTYHDSRWGATSGPLAKTPMIWTSNANTNTTNVIYTHSAPVPHAAPNMQWRDIAITPTLINVGPTEDLWIGYNVRMDWRDKPVLIDDGESIATNRNMWRRATAANWLELSAYSSGYTNLNFCLRATASYPALTRDQEVQAMVLFTHDHSTILNALNNTENDVNRLYISNEDREELLQLITRSPNDGDFIGYRVFRGEEYDSATEITDSGSTPLKVTTFADTSPIMHQFNTYHVVSVLHGTPETLSPPATIVVGVGEPIYHMPFEERFDAFTYQTGRPYIPPFWTRTTPQNTVVRRWSNYRQAASGMGMIVAISRGNVAHLVSPHIRIETPSAGQKPYLFFKVQNEEPSEGTIRFTLSTSTDKSAYQNVSGFEPYVLTEGGWKGKYVDLSSFVGTDIFVRFSTSGNYGDNALLIDDVEVIFVDDENFITNPPTNLRRTGGTQPDINLTWDKPANAHTNLVGYNLYRNGDFLTFVATNSFVDTFPFNTEVEYTVSALYEHPYIEVFATEELPLTFTDGIDLIFSPTNLQITSKDKIPTLTWDEPVFEHTVLTHSHGIPNMAMAQLQGVISSRESSDFMFVHRYDNDDLAGLRGKLIDTFTFYPWADTNHAAVEYELWIFTGTHSVIDGNQINLQGLNWNHSYVQELPVKGLVMGDINTVLLHEPFMIPMTGEVFIGLEMIGHSRFSDVRLLSLRDEGPMALNKGALFHWGDNEFRNFTHYSSAFNSNWDMYITVVDTQDGEVVATLGNTTKTNGRPNRDVVAMVADQASILNRDGNPIFATNNAFRNNRRFIQPYVVIPRGSEIWSGPFDGTPSVVSKGIHLGTSFTFEEPFVDGAYYFAVSALYGPDNALVRSELIHKNAFFGEITLTDFPYNQIFDLDIFPPIGWDIFEDLTPTIPIRSMWERIRINDAFAGDYVMSSQVLFSAPAISSESWIITPRIKVPETGDFNLHFRHRSRGSGNSNFRILISTTGKHRSNFDNGTTVPLTSLAGMPRDGSNQPNVSIGASTAWTRSSWDLVNQREINSLTNPPEHIGDTIGFRGQEIYIAIVQVATSAANRVEISDFWIQGTVSEIEDFIDVPLVSSLRGNYPNPFNPETKINFEMAREGQVRLEVFNIKGQRVSTLVNEVRGVGQHHVIWNGNDDNNRPSASGIYFYRMTTEDRVETKKMLLLK